MIGINGAWGMGSTESVLPFGDAGRLSGVSQKNLTQKPEALRQHLKEFASKVFTHKWDEESMGALMLEKEVREEHCKKLEGDDVSAKKEVLCKFMSELHQRRTGISAGGITFSKAKNISLAYATNMFFGKSLQEVLFDLGYTRNSNTYGEIVEELSIPGYNMLEFKEDFINYSGEKGIGSYLNSHKKNEIYRFLLPELILNAIRIGLEVSSKHLNWISGVQDIAKKKVTLPTLKDGDAAPRRVGEGELISMGTVSFGQKDVEVVKVGKGILFTNDFLFEADIDVVNLFLYKVGVKMSIAEDVYAAHILANGDTKDAGVDESSYIVGTSVLNQFSFRDIKRVSLRMDSLGITPDVMISGQEEGLDIADIAEIKGGNFQSSLLQLAGINSQMPPITNYHMVMPANKVMLLDSSSTMRKLRYRNMRAERRMNPATDTEELFIYNYMGFLITDRTGRVMIDRGQLYSQFPDEMNIEKIYTEQLATLV